MIELKIIEDLFFVSLKIVDVTNFSKMPFLQIYCFELQYAHKKKMDEWLEMQIEYR